MKTPDVTVTAEMCPCLVWLPSPRGAVPQIWYQPHTIDQKPYKVLQAHKLPEDGKVWSLPDETYLDSLARAYPYQSEIVGNMENVKPVAVIAVDTANKATYVEP